MSITIVKKNIAADQPKPAEVMLKLVGLAANDGGLNEVNLLSASQTAFRLLEMGIHCIPV